MKNGNPQTLQEAIIYFADPDVALQFFAAYRWPDGEPTCPHCSSQENSFIKTRRIWKCKGCRKQFSAKIGTVLEDSPISLCKWLPAIWMAVNCKNGISSYELARALGVSQKSAWFMLHRIRLALKNGSMEKLSGEVEADETFIGGRPKLMNSKAKARKIAKGLMPTGGRVGKAIVMGMLERHGEARVKAVPSVKYAPLMRAISENVEPGSAIYTDALQSYRTLVADYAHEVIDHTEAYVKGNVHTNGLENFWSLFKRCLKGTYVSVEPFHLQAYADEQCFRYNQRKEKDAERFTSALSQVADRRLTFAELTGRESGSQPS